MEMPIPGFDVDYFVSALYEFAQEKYGEWAEGKSEDDVAELIVNSYPDAADLDEAAQLFFVDFGSSWGIAPNAYFDAGEYRQAWANAQVDQNYAFTTEKALELYDAEVSEIGGHYAHYLAKGAALGVNPSNDFDESDYLQSLIDGLEIDITVDELRLLAIESGFTPLDFFVSFPEFQDEYPAIPVGEDEAVNVIVTPPQNNAGQTFTLTNVADAIPGLVGSKDSTDTSGDDIIVATDVTLTAGDIINAGEGKDVLRVFQNNEGVHHYAAIEVDGVEEIDVTADGGDADLDLSGVNDLELLKSTNSDKVVTFDEVTTLADIFLNNTTGAPNVEVIYQSKVIDGDADQVAVTIEDSEVGELYIHGDNELVETIDLKNYGEGSSIEELWPVGINTLNVEGTGDIAIQTYLPGTIRLVDASTFEGDLRLGVGFNYGTLFRDPQGNIVDQDNNLIKEFTATIPENTEVVVKGGIGDDTLEITGGMMNVDMGEGDDTVIYDFRNPTNNEGFRSDDTLDGNAGVDTLQLGQLPYFSYEEGESRWALGEFNLSTTEFNNKTSFEVIDVRSALTDMTFSQEFVDSADQTITVRTDMVDEDRGVEDEEFFEWWMITELDLTELDQNTSLTYIGGAGSDRLALDNATFNSYLDLDGGPSHNASNNGFGDHYDTITVVGGSSKTVIDAPDLSNVVNFEGFNLVKASAGATNVVFDIELTDEFIAANTMSDDIENTSVDDEVFYIFSEAVEGGAPLVAGDTVNIDISDLLTSGGALKSNISDRGIDLTDLVDSNVEINYIGGPAGWSNAAIEDLLMGSNVYDAVSLDDVIASRINPIDVDNVLRTMGEGFDTTSGFLIDENKIATQVDDILDVDVNHIRGTNQETINLGAGYDEMRIHGSVDNLPGKALGDNGDVESVNSALANAVDVDLVVLKDGSNAQVNGAIGQDITAEASAIFTVQGGQTATGSSGDDVIWINSLVAGGEIDATAGGNDILRDGLGNDTIYAGDDADIIDMTFGDDLVIAGGGADTIRVTLDGEDSLYLGTGSVDWMGGVVHHADDNSDDVVAIINIDGIDDINDANGDGIVIDNSDVVTITDFNLMDDKLLMASTDNTNVLQATSYGVMIQEATGTGAPSVEGIRNGSILEISSSAYQYSGAAPDEENLLGHMDTNMGVTGVAGAAITVVVYDGDGNAALLQAQNIDGDSSEFDTIELVGILENVGVDTLDSENFA